MPEPSWTPEDVELVARASQVDGTQWDMLCAKYPAAADSIRRVAEKQVAALAEAGRLQPHFVVSERVAPPDWVAYAEDARDRLWTGRGLGTWRCIYSDPQGVTGGPQSWAKAWRDHGPLVPLVPGPWLPVEATDGDKISSKGEKP